MDEKQLNDFGKFLFQRFFEEELTIPIKINNRLKRTHAWFIPDENNPYIEVSKHLVQQTIFVIADILCHELTHYYLFKHNKPYDDEDIEFYALTYKNGISRTNTATVKNGVMKYKYHKHESKCNCGFKIKSCFPVIDNDFRPILICPQCNKEMNYSYMGEEYKDYSPSFRIKMACDWYLDKNHDINLSKA